MYQNLYCILGSQNAIYMKYMYIKYKTNFHTLDLFFGSSDDDSIESKHVAIRTFCVTNSCVSLKFIPCMN